MIPLAVMFARMAAEQQPPENDSTQYRPQITGPGSRIATWLDRPSRGPMPFRPPEQQGPEPPVDPRILARLFEAMK